MGSGGERAADRTPLDPAWLRPSDPLDVHGMRAGETALDHGGFRAAATVAPADLADSTLIEVPPDDLVRIEPSALPMLSAGHVFRTVDVPGGQPVELRADVLVPVSQSADMAAASATGSPSRLPIVVFVPGGGFVQSPRRSALLRRAAVAAAGFVVVSIEYRTLRHGTAFDGVSDVAAAIEWARTAAPEFGGDRARVALWGESAGGYLAALAVTT
ncbi:MAG: alpha/beta hydrolase, partial [Ilumatobacter sp.]|nr:alpha/beta hydrolase [Ilumatobacter sp.]